MVNQYSTRVKVIGCIQRGILMRDFPHYFVDKLKIVLLPEVRVLTTDFALFLLFKSFPVSLFSTWLFQFLLCAYFVLLIMLFGFSINWYFGIANFWRWPKQRQINSSKTSQRRRNEAAAPTVMGAAPTRLNCPLASRQRETVPCAQPEPLKKVKKKAARTAHPCGRQFIAQRNTNSSAQCSFIWSPRKSGEVPRCSSIGPSLTHC